MGGGLARRRGNSSNRRWEVGHARRRGNTSNRRWEGGMLGEGEAAHTEDWGVGVEKCYEKEKQLTEDGRWAC